MSTVVIVPPLPLPLEVTEIVPSGALLIPSPILTPPSVFSSATGRV
jgi:hypothetical protein